MFDAVRSNGFAKGNVNTSSFRAIVFFIQLLRIHMPVFISMTLLCIHDNTENIPIATTDPVAFKSSADQLFSLGSKQSCRTLTF